MPNFDKTGPSGEGSRTGRGTGNCPPHPSRNYRMSDGRGPGGHIPDGTGPYGRGRGRGRGMGDGSGMRRP